MKNLIGLNIVSILLFTNCNQPSEKTNEPTEYFGEKIDLISSPILIDRVDFNTPLEMMIIDSILIIHDQFIVDEEIYLFTALNINNTTRVTYFGREGRGPNEYAFPSSLSKIPSIKDYIAINNRQLFSMSIVSINSIIEGQKLDSLDYITQLDYRYSKVVPVSNKLFIGTGFFELGRFGVADQSGKIKNTFGEYPYAENYINLTNPELGMIFQTDLKVHPKHKKVVATTFASANLDILEVSTDTVKILHSTNYYSPKFKSNSSGERLSAQPLADNRSGFIRTSVNESYIYILYSGEKRSEGLNKYLSGYRILKFTWDGVPVAQYNLDRHVSMISVDEKDKFLIAMHTDKNGKPVLLKYDL
jgi:hypothetical protein